MPETPSALHIVEYQAYRKHVVLLICTLLAGLLGLIALCLSTLYLSTIYNEKTQLREQVESEAREIRALALTDTNERCSF